MSVNKNADMVITSNGLLVRFHSSSLFSPDRMTTKIQSAVTAAGSLTTMINNQTIKTVTGMDKIEPSALISADVPKVHSKQPSAMNNKVLNPMVNSRQSTSGSKLEKVQDGTQVPPVKFIDLPPAKGAIIGSADTNTIIGKYANRLLNKSKPPKIDCGQMQPFAHFCSHLVERIPICKDANIIANIKDASIKFANSKVTSPEIRPFTSCYEEFLRLPLANISGFPAEDIKIFESSDGLLVFQIPKFEKDKSDIKNKLYLKLSDSVWQRVGGRDPSLYLIWDHNDPQSKLGTFRTTRLGSAMLPFGFEARFDKKQFRKLIGAADEKKS